MASGQLLSNDCRKAVTHTLESAVFTFRIYSRYQIIISYIGFILMWSCSKYNLRTLNVYLHIAMVYTVFVTEVPILGSVWFPSSQLKHWDFKRKA